MGGSTCLQTTNRITTTIDNIHPIVRAKVECSNRKECIGIVDIGSSYSTFRLCIDAIYTPTAVDVITDGTSLVHKKKNRYGNIYAILFNITYY